MLLTRRTKGKKKKVCWEGFDVAGLCPQIALDDTGVAHVLWFSLSLPKQVNGVKWLWCNGSWQMCVATVEWQQWSKRVRTGLGPIHMVVTERPGRLAVDWAAENHNIQRHFYTKSLIDTIFCLLTVFLPNSKSPLPSSIITLACCSGIPTSSLTQSQPWECFTQCWFSFESVFWSDQVNLRHEAECRSVLHWGLFPLVLPGSVSSTVCSFLISSHIPALRAGGSCRPEWEW